MSNVTRVTLEITWDETVCCHPAQWDWPTILDLTPDESVEVFDYEDHQTGETADCPAMEDSENEQD